MDDTVNSDTAVQMRRSSKPLDVRDASRSVVLRDGAMLLCWILRRAVVEAVNPDAWGMVVPQHAERMTSKTIRIPKSTLVTGEWSLALDLRYYSQFLLLLTINFQLMD